MYTSPPIPTYSETDEFPSNCWFADWQPNEETFGPGGGHMLVRCRDAHATIHLTEITVHPARCPEMTLDAATVLARGMCGVMQGGRPPL